MVPSTTFLQERLLRAGIRDVVTVEPATGGLAALAGLATRQDAPSVFVKAFADAPAADVFLAEAEGLTALRDLGGVATPTSSWRTAVGPTSTAVVPLRSVPKLATDRLGVSVEPAPIEGNLMDDEVESAASGRKLSVILRWLAATAAVAGIVGVVFQVIEWVGDRTPSPPQASASVSPSGPGGPVRADANEQLIQVGQCVRNVGDAETPVLAVAPCEIGTLRVVARVEQVIADEDEAQAVCQRARPDFTDYHYSNWAKRSDYADIVFCLRPA